MTDNTEFKEVVKADMLEIKSLCDKNLDAQTIRWYKRTKQ